MTNQNTGGISAIGSFRLFSSGLESASERETERSHPSSPKARKWGGLWCFTALAGTVLPFQARADLGNAPGGTVLESVERGLHHRVWRAVREFKSGDKSIFQTNSIVELQNGLHRFDPKLNDFVETDSRIELFQDGAVVRNLQYNVVFAPNLASPGALDIQLPDGSRLTGQIMGLAFIEGAKSVLIAETRDCVGEVGGPNQNLLTYKSAFTDFQIDVVYEVQRASLSQTVIFRERLPSPTQYGLTENAHLELMTEWTTAPQVQKETFVLEPAHDGENALTDEHISLGSMSFMTGRAFSLGEEASPTGLLIPKSWEQIDGRTFLLEKIPWPQIQPEFQKLPPPQAAIGRKSANGSLLASQGRQLPARKKIARTIRPIRMAQLGHTPEKGLAADFELVSSIGTFTFKADTTYYISGLVSIDTNTFESCVVKYAPTNSASLKINYSLTCLSSAYRPVVLTARDDHTVGTPIGSNTLSGYYASTALNLYYNNGIPYTNVHDIRISYAWNGILFYASRGNVVSHAQFVNCQTGYQNYQADARFRNMLAYNIDTICVGSSASLCTSYWEHVTLDQVGHFNDTTNCIFFLTNCLLVAVTNTGPYSGANNASNSNPASVFQPTGASMAYLLPNSPYRDSGTTNIHPTLLAALRLRTTVAPIVYSQTNVITVPTTWYPVAQRDTDVPDLGFHISPIDYEVGYLAVSNATLTISPGTAVAVFGWGGLILNDNSFLNCAGSPTSRNHFCRYYCVQEVSTNLGGVNYPAVNLYSYNYGNGRPSAFIRFTDFDELSDAYFHFEFMDSSRAPSSITLQDCTISASRVQVAGDGASSFALRNNLFERVIAQFQFYPANVTCYNNLFWNGTTEFYNDAPTAWIIKDNAFDGTSLTSDGLIVHSNNAYINMSARLTPTNANDVVLSSLAYQPGILGQYYQPTNSALINAGSRNATNAGLYFFTTTTNQVRETNSIVDVGFHLAAMDLTTGLALDFDSDSLADYYENTAGDGGYHSATGETDWQSYNSKYGIGPGPGLVVFTPLK